MRRGAGERLFCLQIEPDNEEEAIRLRQGGHVCDIVLCEPDQNTETGWQRPPLIADPMRLPVDSNRYDLVLSGAFGRITGSAERRRAGARELARVCKKGGAVLLTIGNRGCPVDLSGNAPPLHGPWHPALVTLGEMERIFVHEGGFAALAPLSLAGHFSGASLSGAKRIVARCLNRYLQWSSVPGRRYIYAGPLNPMLSLWIER